MHVALYLAELLESCEIPSDVAPPWRRPSGFVSALAPVLVRRRAGMEDEEITNRRFTVA